MSTPNEKLIRQLVDALKAARPLLIGALAFVDCKKELAQFDAALKMAEGVKT